MWYLHSNLVIFKYFCFTNFSLSSKYLHSNLVIFKLPNNTDFNTINQPLTFQSGDIQISFVCFSPPLGYSHLHSNLVIFKCVIYAKIINKQFIFTFQSGDIQILKNLTKSLGFKRFTFQSGDIQIPLLLFCLLLFSYNLHSNLVIFKLREQIINRMDNVELFTFQSGDIQIEK